MDFKSGYIDIGSPQTADKMYKGYALVSMHDEIVYAKYSVVLALHVYITRLARSSFDAKKNHVHVGYCYASMKTMAKHFCKDQGTIKRALDKLEKDGLIKIFSKKSLAVNPDSTKLTVEKNYYFPVAEDGSSIFGISIPALSDDEEKEINDILSKYNAGEISRADGNKRIREIYAQFDIFMNDISNHIPNKLSDEDSEKIVNIREQESLDIKNSKSEYVNDIRVKAQSEINEICKKAVLISPTIFNQKSVNEKKLSTVDNTGSNFKAKKEYTEEYVINWFNSQTYHWKYPTDTTSRIYTKMVKGKKFTEDGIINLLTSCVNLNNKKSTLKKVELTEADLNELKELQDFDY